MSQVSTKSGAAAAPGTSLEEVMARLQTSRDGLTSQEAQHRLARDGSNELPEKEVNPLLKFLSYFWGPIPWMIEIAAGLSALVRHWADLVVILAMLLVNAGVGIWQEAKGLKLLVYRLIEHHPRGQARHLAPVEGATRCQSATVGTRRTEVQEHSSQLRI